MITSYDMHTTKHKMLRSPFNCTQGSKVVIDRWGELGYMRRCVLKNGKNHGTWEYQRLKIEGNFVDGKKHGEWRWWDKNSMHPKTREYENDVEIIQEGSKDYFY